MFAWKLELEAHPKAEKLESRYWKPTSASLAQGSAARMRCVFERHSATTKSHPNSFGIVRAFHTQRGYTSLGSAVTGAGSDSFEALLPAPQIKTEARRGPYRRG